MTAAKHKGDQIGTPRRNMFTIAPGIPASSAIEQATKLMDCARHLNITGVMIGNRQMIWVSYHLSAMVRALLEKIELNLKR
ncbi:TPA: DUF3077 domain-containing protein [Pseudomonas putida]|nr:DUF3077 domain-containing protein [Pseudomonas putida]HEN8719572.1 DUF3077 domain-containing protein [Pseudomonas putida]